jgi:endonuclease YncB( thermonuclease family)
MVGQPVTSIDWGDADSGTVNGIDFRLADIDAPETGGVGSPNGAKCIEERAQGFETTEWLRSTLAGKSVVITGHDPKPDNWDRVVMTLSVDGQDLGALGLAAGRYKPYMFENGRAVGKKPVWCP